MATAQLDETATDAILAYAFAVASLEDDAFERRLGPIHLIKYAYLADLENARAKGVSLTGAQWKFYHFGPWSHDVQKRIAAVATAYDLVAHTFQSNFDKDDFTRWEMPAERAEELIPQLEAQLPVRATVAVKRAVHAFTNHTSELLDHVYRTAPMLNAAPNENLDLEASTAEAPVSRVATATSDIRPFSEKQLKKMRERMVTKMAEYRKRPPGQRLGRVVVPAPNYDAEFIEGTRYLNSLAGPDPAELLSEGTELTIDDSIWKSESRRRGLP